jgi:SIR2-like domain
LLKVPTRLKMAIQDDPQNLVLWVGAGLSREGVLPLGKGLPDWHELMGLMVEHLEDNRYAPAVIDKAKKALEEERYPDVASVFAKSTDLQEFADFFRGVLDPPDVASSPAHELILRTGLRAIFTTNFDRVFERQTTGVDTVLKYPQCLDDPAFFRRRGLLAKIHGCVTQASPSQMVLTSSNYRALGANKKYKEILHSVILGNSVLTVGFSFRDPAFKAVLSQLRDVFGENLPPVFALMRQADDSIIKKLRKKRVDVIRYENRKQLVSLFRQLLNIAERRRPPATVRVQAAPLSADLSDVKNRAWDFYCGWRREASGGNFHCPALGRVHITLKGWRHIKRHVKGTRTPQREVAHRLSLLPCAKEVLQKATNARPVRTLFGRRKLLCVQGVHTSRHEADIIVNVIVEQYQSKFGEPRHTFLSVYEERRSAYIGEQGRDLS